MLNNVDKYGNPIYGLVITDNGEVKPITNPKDFTKESLQTQYNDALLYQIDLGITKETINKKLCEDNGYVWDEDTMSCRINNSCYIENGEQQDVIGNIRDNIAQIKEELIGYYDLIEKEELNDILLSNEFPIETEYNDLQVTQTDSQTQSLGVAIPQTPNIIGNLGVSLSLEQENLNSAKKEQPRKPIKLLFGIDGKNPINFTVNSDYNQECLDEINTLRIEYNKLILDNTDMLSSISELSNRLSNETNPKLIAELQKTQINLQNQTVINSKNITELEERINSLNEVCDTELPKCALNIKFNYLWNFDCKTLLNCAKVSSGNGLGLGKKLTDCNLKLGIINFKITQIEGILNTTSKQISDLILELNGLEEDLNSCDDPGECYNIQIQINNLKAQVVPLNNSYTEEYDKYNEVKNEYDEQKRICNRLSEILEQTEGLGDLISKLQGVKFYLTVEKKIDATVPEGVLVTTPQYTWETVFREEFFRIDNFIEHIRNNTKTGVYLSGDECGDLVEYIKLLLGENCDLLKPETLFSPWKTLDKTISDPEFIKKILNEDILFGIEIEYDSDCQYCLLIDNIEFNQTCEKTDVVSVLVDRCPGFNLNRVIDNKKSWVKIDTRHKREFDFPTRETDYTVLSERATINTKELELNLDAASAIENDFYNAVKFDDCIIGENFLSLMSTDINDTNVNTMSMVLSSELVDAKTRKHLGGYPVLYSIYERYLNQGSFGCTGQTNAYTYCDIHKFSDVLVSHWADLIEQVIPATSLWGSSYNYRNTIFHQQKFNYKPYSLRYCTKPKPIQLSRFRVPTEAEWEAERLSWDSNDSEGAFASPLKLTVAGNRNRSNGALNNVGGYGYYWSSTVYITYVRLLYFHSSNAGLLSYYRAYGCSLRLILDGEYEELDYQNDWEGKEFLFDDKTYGVCYNPTTKRVWLDRNLGASQVATALDDADAYGDLYQWGRAAEGHQVRTSDIHNTGLANTPTPNAGNDWDGKFITIDSEPYDWLDPQDDNLWQGVNGVNVPDITGHVTNTDKDDCDYSGGSISGVTVTIEDITKDNLVEYPECFELESRDRYCDVASTNDFDYSCEYRGRVYELGDEVNNIIDEDVIIITELFVPEQTNL